MRAIPLRAIDGFTPIDWWMVIERAAAIVTIDTSLVLLVEVVKPRAAHLKVISRYSPPHFRPLRPILRLPWTFEPNVE
jgi:hypothetical protein